MNSPKVSIVIPTYNRTEYLKKAIQSALNQTYQEIEVIVVDDNKNKPDIREWVETLMKEYPQVVYVQNDKNLGGGKNRNRGIEVATGEMIAFLDDDDFFEPEKIQMQMDCYQSHANDNVGLIYCYARAVSVNGKTLGVYENNNEGRPIYEQMLNCLAGTSLWFVPKKVIVEVGMFENVPSKQDSITLLKILAAGYEVYRVPQILVNYLEDNEGKISGTGEKNIEGLLLYRVWARKYYEELINMQIDQVEYVFAKQLVTYYVLNHKYEKARIEYEIMCQMKYFHIQTLAAYFKITFPKQYINWLKKKKEKEKRKNDLA